MDGSPSLDTRRAAPVLGVGRAAEAIQGRDWALTSLGPLSSWPHSLSTSLRIILAGQTPQAIFWGADQTLLANDAFFDHFSLNHEILIGTSPGETWADAARLTRSLERGMSGEPGWEQSFEVVGVKIGEIEGDWACVPIPGDDGSPGGVLCQWRPSTEPAISTGKTAGADDVDLRDRELRYRLVAEAAGSYIWDWDFRSDRVIRNGGLQTLFGYPAEEVEGDLSWGVDRIHPKDRDIVMSGIRAAKDGGEDAWSGEYRFRRADGTYAQVTTRAHFVRDERGDAVRLIGVMRDLTEQRKHEQSLRDVEQRFRALTMNAPVAIYLKDIEGRYTLCNPLASQSLGRPRGVAGLTDQELLPSEVAEQRQSRDQQVIASGQPVEYEETLHVSGSERHYLSVEFPLRNSASETVGVGGVAVDITDRKQAQLALRESERRLLLATQTGKVGVWAWEIESNRVSWSESLQGILGVSPEDLGTSIDSFESLLHPDDRERVERALLSAVKDDLPLELEFRAVRPDGEEIWLFNTGSVIRDSSRAVRMLGATLDITDRKRSEMALRESEERFRTLASHAPVGIFQTNLQGENVFVNEGWCKMAGMTPEEARGLGWMRAIHPDDREAVVSGWRRAISDGLSSSAEFRFLRPDGVVTWLQGNAVPLRDVSGRNVGYIGTVADITDRKKGEAALRNSELMYRAIGESIDYGIWVSDAEGKNLYSSESFLKLVGLSQEQCSDFGWCDVLHPDDVDQTIAAWKQCVLAEESWDVEHRFRGVDGRWHPVLARGVPVKNDQGEVIAWVGINLDISELKRIESDLRESEARFRNMADNAPVLIWVHGVGGCQYVNKEYLRFVGAGLDDLQGMNWINFIHPEEIDGFVDSYRQAFKAQQAIDAQLRMRRADGEYCWLSVNGTPRFRADGAFLGYVGCSVDITDIKNSENALREADRRKDDFLAMLGHELRNPLAGIVTGAQVLGMLPLGGEAEEMQAVISRQAAQMSRIVDDLLDVSRIARGKLRLRRQPVNLCQLLQDTVADYRKSRVLEQCELKVDVPACDVWVRADSARLSQALSNIIHNSYKFGDGPNVILVELHSNAEAREANIIIRDRGIGMSAETLGRVFEPFSQADSSLERSRGGLGLGLALTKGLIELHGGRVAAESEGLGKGASFTLTLLQSRAPSQKADDSSAAPAAERILIIDDRRDAILPLNQMLLMEGHTVAMAQDGFSGIAKAVEFQPHVILCDIGLPGEVDGYAVCRALRLKAETSGAYLVAVTGYGHEEARRMAKEAGFDFHITKPLGKSTLREILANRPRL